MFERLKKISEVNALEMLREGQEGVLKWNRLREKGAKIPDLRYAYLAGADLIDANLEYAGLVRAILEGAKLQGAHLQRAHLGFARLRNADLRGALLYGASLIDADLEEADLRGARFDGANLDHARLRNADLRGASLDRASLEDADLEKADLRGARLQNANLVRADLKRAVFNQASCGWTNFSTDLSLAVGLNDTSHVRPSAVTPDSIERFADRLPEKFLRGCGWNDEWIAYARSQVGSPIEFFNGFISYCHADMDFVRRLHDQLQGQGIRCWRDEKDMHGGDSISESINRAIRVHDKLIICCSEASLNSKAVLNELTTGFDQESQDGHNKLIPIDLDGYFLKWQGKFSAELRDRLAIRFEGWERDNSVFEQQFERLVDALRPRDRSPQRTPFSSG